MIEKTMHIHDFIDQRQKSGMLFLQKDDVLGTLGGTSESIDLSFSRLVGQHRLYRIRKGLYGITPLEYQDQGCPPADWFIDQMMKQGSDDYYVGLLSAAVLHGAGHQQPMQFQVVTNNLTIRNWTYHRTKIAFYKKHFFPKTGLVKVRTATGEMWVSGPELTAFDLVRYPIAAGQFNNILTVLSELGEKLKSTIFKQLAQEISSHRGEVVYWQRLGYLLDELGFSKATSALEKFIHENRPSYKYLVSSSTKSKLQKSEKWRLYINQKLEADT